ncbi:MAG: methylenetetrahydrofolate reductase [NAD(P)H] [Nitratireductor sp.]|nr:methylenetetrahydrofolate reductase [NAD(P)H] [Nitratireductor sp.]
MNARLSRRPLNETAIEVSFEFFPPSTDAMEQVLWKSVERLAPLQPQFVSVTYGAGGTTRERTVRTIAQIIADTKLNVAGHLTCVDASREEVDSVIRQYRDAGVTTILALRGDPAAGIGARYEARPDGYRNAADLCAGISAIGGFDIAVSAYPEKHPESPDFATDIDMLKRKVDNGATRAITQFFFDNDTYEAYVERVRRAGIYIPVIPGILPVHDFAKVAGFAARCGAHVPSWLADRFSGLENDPQTRQLVAAAVAAEQVIDLIERGVSTFHFYTMNRADLSFAICHLLGLRARPAQSAAHATPAAA